MMKAEKAASWAFRSRGRVGAALAVLFGLLAALSLLGAGAPPAAPAELKALGWLIFIAGAVVRFWATLYVGGRKAVRLVREGPYSLCRNPLYVGSLLIALSAPLMLASGTLAAGVLAAAAFYALATVPAEEAYLRDRLGQPYERYCEEVPRFLPRLSGFCTSRTIVVSVKSLRLECWRAARWIWLPLVIELAERLRDRATG